MSHLPPFEPGRSRRSFLAVVAGGAAGLAAGCSPSDTSAPADTSVPPPSPASTPAAARTTPRPDASPSATPSPRPSASRSPRPQPPTAGEIVRRATVPVLCYHQLREWRSGDSDYARNSLICPPKNFRRHLDALAEEGWTTISPDQYHAHLTAGKALPGKPVMLSFDDGTRSQVTAGLPELVERQMTGTFFLMTVVLDKPTWIRRRDITKLADAGMTIGCHTYDHPGVDSLHGEDWEIQLEDSRKTLQKASGQPVGDFAYPFGINERRAYRHLEEAGYRTAYQLKDKKIDRSAPLYTLQRLLVGSTWSGAELLRQMRD